MPDIQDLVDDTLLEQRPPRRLPAMFLPNLIGEYLLERAGRAARDPILLFCVVTGVALLIVGAPLVAWLLLALLLAMRLGGPLLKIFRNVREDYLLLRYGVVVQAHILGVRPCRNGAGQPAGAYLDCVIPVTGKRSSVGSVWMPDTADALRIGAAGRVAVVCLARAPGTWRLRNGDSPHLRYEPAKQ